ncbi:hypothetical protein [Vibrio crassostreae]|uniref:hypothetical protein n=1 Tax=Vibrio crassostreae TaxID=246167 RepID=UPI001049E065|nr:hypothetical protein [Vibrio crassostreae]TCT61649.1 hypothetical protein EDB31_13834 [Vibrio crassostreae]
MKLEDYFTGYDKKNSAHEFWLEQVRVSDGDGMNSSVEDWLKGLSAAERQSLLRQWTQKFGKKTKTLSPRLSINMYRDFEKLANRHHLSMNQMVTKLIREALEKPVIEQQLEGLSDQIMQLSKQQEEFLDSLTKPN